MHNWPLQPFSQNYGLASHITHVVCVNFMREWRDLQFNVDSERQIFEKLFHGNFIYSQTFCQKSAERKSSKKYFSYFNFFDDWPGIRTQAFASNKPTHYILDHGDYHWLNSQFNSPKQLSQVTQPSIMNRTVPEDKLYVVQLLLTFIQAAEIPHPFCGATSRWTIMNPPFSLTLDFIDPNRLYVLLPWFIAKTSNYIANQPILSAILLHLPMSP